MFLVVTVAVEHTVLGWRRAQRSSLIVLGWRALGVRRGGNLHKPGQVHGQWLGRSSWVCGLGFAMPRPECFPGMGKEPGPCCCCLLHLDSWKCPLEHYSLIDGCCREAASILLRVLWDGLLYSGAGVFIGVGLW